MVDANSLQTATMGCKLIILTETTQKSLLHKLCQLSASTYVMHQGTLTKINIYSVDYVAI